MPVELAPAMSSGSPITFHTCPSVPSPTGIVMPRPRLRTGVPRFSPSVGFMQMARTRLSPICCATSAVTVIFSPSSSMSISSALLISGSASGGNSTSMTGPAIATTRPSLAVGSAVVVMPAPVLRVSGWVAYAGLRLVAVARPDPRASAPPTISMISVVIAS